MTVRVKNSGNVVLTPVAHLKVSSTFGTTTTRTFSTGPLLPGESVARRFTVPVRTTGRLEAQLSAAASGVRATASSSQFNLPWGLIILVLALGGGAGVNARAPSSPQETGEAGNRAAGR